jgi:hypothetical protein
VMRSSSSLVEEQKAACSQAAFHFEAETRKTSSVKNVGAEYLVL